MTGPQGYEPPPVHHAHPLHVELPPPTPHYIHPDVIRAQQEERARQWEESLRHPILGLVAAALSAPLSGFFCFKVVMNIGWWAIMPPGLAVLVVAGGLGFFVAILI